VRRDRSCKEEKREREGYRVKRDRSCMGVDLNKARMRWVVEALIGLCVSPSEAQRFTASELARQLRLLSNQAESDYEPRRAAYDLKKLRAKNIVQRIGQTCRYKSTPSGLKAMVALVILRN
jgi:hypothetical protein